MQVHSTAEGAQHSPAKAPSTLQPKAPSTLQPKASSEERYFVQSPSRLPEYFIVIVIGWPPRPVVIFIVPL